MAASTRITYNASAAMGGQNVASAVRCIVQAQEFIARAMEVANSITAGGVTGANLEGSPEFGAAAGQGGTLYTAMNNLKANLATVTAAQLGDLFAG